MAACGGGGPVSSSTQLKDVTPAEAVDECKYLADQYPPRKVTCTENGQSTTLTIGNDGTKCSTATTDDVPDTCTATVGDLEDCDDAIYSLSDDEICNSTSEPAACAAIDADSCSGDTTARKTGHVRVVRQSSLSAR